MDTPTENATRPDVYARPGEPRIIDTINRITGLSMYGDMTADQIAADYPGAVRMSWETWAAAAVATQRTPIEWRETTAEQYHEMLNVLPPAFWHNGIFLVGEPSDGDVLTGRPRFSAYRQINDSYTVASRPITIAEAREVAR